MILFSSSWWNHLYFWKHCRKCTLLAWIGHCHIGPSLTSVRNTIECMSESLLLHSDGTLKSSWCIYIYLKSVAMPSIQALLNAMFQQDTSKLYETSIVQIFLDTKSFDCFPDLHDLQTNLLQQKVWSIVADRPAAGHMSGFIIDKLRNLVETSRLFLYISSNICRTQCKGL